MTQLDISSMLNPGTRDPKTALNETTTETYAKLGIGSIFNSPFPAPTDGYILWTADEWNDVLSQIKAIYKKHSKTPIVHAVDTIHGANYVRNATIFPQPLAAASSFNPDLVYEVGRIEAKDTLAAGTPWIFSPVLGISVQPKWSRVYETFGEDPYVVSVMADHIIRGIQSSGKVAACMKHFIGYSNPTSGLDRADNVITDFELLNYYAPSFISAVNAGVETAMETYISVNGMPVIASHKILTDLLRNDMQFQGLLVSDDAEVDRMYFEHHLVSSVPEAVEVSFMQTSLDINMGPRVYDYLDTVEKLVQKGIVPESRLDESVKRILKLKQNLGLFKEETTEDEDPVGSDVDQRTSLELATESVILLENDKKTLPLDPHKPSKVFLTGPLADNKGYMCGGWSVYWQGSSNSSNFPHGKTLKQALEDESDRLDVSYLEGVDIKGVGSPDTFEKAYELASQSEYTIVALGEDIYAEKRGDITDLSLAQGQLEYLKALSSISTTKVILVLVSGRPRLLNEAHADVHAAVASFLPCEQGGEAIANVLLGRSNPSGKLPLTYPKHSTQLLPYFHLVNTMCPTFDECETEWSFGHGLSYSTFEYSNLRLSTPKVDMHSDLKVMLTIRNTGSVAGKEVVLLFLSQHARRVHVPEQKMLKKFTKIKLGPGESKDVAFVLGYADWSYYLPSVGTGLQRQAEAGWFTVAIGVKDESGAPALTSTFQLTT